MKHIGIIPDGARRWAKENHYSERDAYFKSMQLLYDYVSFFLSNSVQYISIYLCSRDNVVRRSKSNKNNAYAAQIFFLTDLLPRLLDKYDFQVIIAGSTNLVPLDYKKAVDEIESKSQISSPKKIYLLIAYSSVEEIKQAANKSIKNFESYLWVKENVDILIRTSVDGRLSDFLPLQSAYAEIFFIDKYFNDTSEKDLIKILDEYKSRKRRYGK